MYILIVKLKGGKEFCFDIYEIKSESRTIKGQLVNDHHVTELGFDNVDDFNLKKI